MKSLIFLFIASVSIQTVIYGQPGKPSGKQKKNSEYIRSFDDSNPINKDDVMRFEDTVIVQEPGREIPQIRDKRNHGNLINPYDAIASERFPGSEKFYARRPELARPYDKSFIIPPVSPGEKYYLIIKDPITRRVIK